MEYCQVIFPNPGLDTVERGMILMAFSIKIKSAIKLRRLSFAFENFRYVCWAFISIRISVTARVGKLDEAWTNMENDNCTGSLTRPQYTIIHAILLRSDAKVCQ